MKLMNLQRENILQASVEIGHPPGGQRAAQPLTLDQVVQQYSNDFDDKLGQLEERLHLDIDLTVTPVQLPVRRIPVSVKDELITELDQLDRDKLIGFWHAVLGKETSNLTTFGTPIDHYKWKRMPFGISPAPEVFQRRLNQAQEGLNDIYVIANDILVTSGGSTLE